MISTVWNAIYGFISGILNAIWSVVSSIWNSISAHISAVLNAMSLTESAKAAGHPVVHSSVKRILSRECYCGDDFYPAIIDAAVFQRAKSELKQRADNKNQTGKTRRIIPKPETEFTFSPPQTQYDDPYRQAEYLYGLIESKVVKCQK